MTSSVGAMVSPSEELETAIRAWGRPPPTTERARCENAENVVRNAIRAHRPLQERKIEVLAQGSYRNGTNVRDESDVDICVRCSDPFFYDLPPGLSMGTAGLIASPYTYGEFKNEVQAALESYLGGRAVNRGNKALDLHENSYRVDADVVPTFEHRRYFVGGDGRLHFVSGTEFHPDRGGRIINWPDQNYRNGTDTNQRTGERFKKIVRILKRLRNHMAAKGVGAAELAPSYLVECLVWNVPDEHFLGDSYVLNVRDVLLSAYGVTKPGAPSAGMMEINGVKPLFAAGQPWSQATANAFAVAAWNYLGY